jgi:hypothetical protein
VQNGWSYQVRFITYKRTYNLKGALGEQEAIWLVDEIRAWLEQHHN